MFESKFFLGVVLVLVLTLLAVGAFYATEQSIQTKKYLLVESTQVSGATAKVGGESYSGEVGSVRSYGSVNSGLLFAAQSVTGLQTDSRLIGYSTSHGNIAPSDINYENMNSVQRAHFTPVYGTGTPFPIRFEEQQFDYYGQTPYFLLNGRLYPKESFNMFNENDKSLATPFYPVRR